MRGILIVALLCASCGGVSVPCGPQPDPVLYDCDPADTLGMGELPSMPLVHRSADGSARQCLRGTDHVCQSASTDFWCCPRQCHEYYSDTSRSSQSSSSTNTPAASQYGQSCGPSSVSS